MRKIAFIIVILFLFVSTSYAWQKQERELKRGKELKELQSRFEW